MPKISIDRALDAPLVERDRARRGRSDLFDRIVCGVDGSKESIEAARQAARLVSPDGRIVLVGVAEVGEAVHAGWDATGLARVIRLDAERALEQADAAIAPFRLAERRLVEGGVVQSLIAEARRERATLVCVGTRGHGRAIGIVLGSVVTTLAHEAPCSVLVARCSPRGTSFPSALVVGSDGSGGAEQAIAVATSVRERFGASIRVVIATGDASPKVKAAMRMHPEAERIDCGALEALVAASSSADLVVVGSRGLHGVKALGSVSERIVHQARCSVLVVRES